MMSISPTFKKTSSPNSLLVLMSVISSCVYKFSAFYMVWVVKHLKVYIIFSFVPRLQTIM